MTLNVECEYCNADCCKEQLSSTMECVPSVREIRNNLRLFCFLISILKIGAVIGSCLHRFFSLSYDSLQQRYINNAISTTLISKTLLCP